MKYNFKKLMEIVQQLRHPKTGCPWDNAQTSKSLVPNFIEELYESIEAIDNENYEDLSEELGDLLLHICLQINIAAEKKQFSDDDVFKKIIEKLVRRHPHIFADNNASDANEVKKNWEMIKMEEKKQRKSILDGIPKSMSSLIVAQRTQEKAAAIGFDWQDSQPVFGKLVEEKNELLQAINSNNDDNIEEEIGDLLFTLVNLSRKLGFDADTALRKSNEKFTNRFKKLEQYYKDHQIDLQKSSLEEMDKVWNIIKHYKNEVES
ncbi:MAG: nucleoside triphosphate pyrophosphohydrolase [Candidatus Cloacimonadales bacterium]|jgi:MazG family protein|nr:nucleoside triphosphate pyrophosphohydrolase [Candidatus Cloacimonadota bacterium]MDD3501912.1 nucleoside triphosphate pyrophosphohydrolase [Candidatus Cloacimonadota bacterium]MDX9976650.1 nucleoside triphosphate pyrophosphohydrolase [Candidatus Cloacimonadales bacterium]